VLRLALAATAIAALFVVRSARSVGGPTARLMQRSE